MNVLWLIRKGVGRIEAGKAFMGVQVESIHKFGDIVNVKFKTNGKGGRPPLTVHMSEVVDIGVE